MLSGIRRLRFSSVAKKGESILIRGGTVVNHDQKFQADVQVENGKISKIAAPGTLSSSPSCKVFDGKSKLIMPGGVETHSHLQMPFMGTTSQDCFDTGTRANAAGGSTFLLDFIVPKPGESLLKAYEQWRNWADGKVHHDYGLHCCITWWSDQVEKEMEQLVKLGVTSFKFFLAYKGSLMVNDDEMIKCLQRCKELGALSMVHAENGHLIEHLQKKVLSCGVTGPEGHMLSRSKEVEAEATHRAITFANEIGTPLYVVHLMGTEAAEEVIRARQKGYQVFGETLASTLGIDGRKYLDRNWDVAAGAVMSPALSMDPECKVRMMKYLSMGAIHTVGTDNCTFSQAQKRKGQDDFTKIPNGCNGLEDRMSVVWSNGVRKGLLTPMDFVRVTSTQAAQIFNVYPQKGRIAEGSDADIVIWDPEFKHTVSHKHHNHAHDHNVFEGMELTGKASTTIAGGNVLWDNGVFHPAKGSGKYVERKSFGYPYERTEKLDSERDYKKFIVDRTEKKEQGSAEAKLEKAQEELRNANAQIHALQAELRRQVSAGSSCESTPKTHSCQAGNHSQMTNTTQASPAAASSCTKDMFSSDGQLISIEKAFDKYLPADVKAKVKKIIYGQSFQDLELSEGTKRLAALHGFEVAGYKIGAAVEQLREKRLVRVGAVQNIYKSPTTDPIAKQRDAMMAYNDKIIEAAALSGVKIICFQEIWTCPFFLSTREKLPWVELAESATDGYSTLHLIELAKKYGMVIVNSILERDTERSTIFNACVVINETGRVMGKYRKSHIPRVGDFNESTYYMEGDTGHPVFDTTFGKVGVNICYDRHHPMSWQQLGLNGAEIVFNPSATTDGLSEPMWAIEARNAAIANHYFSVGINRVGTEIYPNEYTSGDGKPAHKDFGHFYGSSYIAAPDASRTPGLSRTNDGLLIAELDLNLCQQIKDKWGFTMTGRHDYYAKKLTEWTQPGFKQHIVK